MLLSINLQGLELSTFRGELPAQPGIAAESLRAAGGFAELLGLRAASGTPVPALPLAAGPEDSGGEALPEDGRSLPPQDLLAPDWGIEWPAHPAPAAPPLVAMPVVDEVITPVRRDGMADSLRKYDALPTVPAEAEAPRAERGPREAVSPALPLPARAAAESPVDLRPLTALPERPQRPDLKQAATPAAAAGAEAHDLETLLSGDDARHRSPIEAPVRRLFTEPGGDARAAMPAMPRNALPQRAAFPLPARALVVADARAGLAPAATAEPDPLPRVSASPPAEPVVLRPGIAPLPLSSATPAPAASLPRIDVPVLDPAWGDALNERVTFMSGKDIRNAEIRLNPAELGPIRVQLSVDDRGTSVSFTAQHAQTRDAIEQALPRLRELFSEQGLSLGQASVSDQGVRHGRDGLGAEQAEWLAADAVSEDIDDVSRPAETRRSADGLVDTFA